MKSLVLLAIAAIASPLSAAEPPEAFNGLFEPETPVKGRIGMVLPPPAIDKYVAKVEAAARKNPEWFKDFSANSKPGVPLPYHENLGLTKEEYNEYLKLWSQREFRPIEEVVIVLRESVNNTWSLTATGGASMLTTLRYSPADDTFRSPNGTLKRIDDIDADANSILGAWSGREWKFEEETSLGQTKENIALGTFDGNKFGLIVYRLQEISSEGTRIIDKSLVVRFALGKARTPCSPPHRPNHNP